MREGQRASGAEVVFNRIRHDRIYQIHPSAYIKLLRLIGRVLIEAQRPHARWQHLDCPPVLAVPLHAGRWCGEVEGRGLLGVLYRVEFVRKSADFFGDVVDVHVNGE